MTQSGYANAIVDAMLSWLKGLASWVLKLFDLSSGYSPLKFLANNWLKLLVVLLIIGMVVDLLVWLIRWRPHWVWFHKKRVIINDKDFFNQEKQRDVQAQTEARSGARPRRNWEDSEYVVPGAARRRREEMARREEQLRLAREKRLRTGEPKDVFQDELFDVNAEKKSSDTYEDAVFSVSNLPKPETETSAQTVRSGKTQAARRRSNPAAQRNRAQATRRSKPQSVRTVQTRPGMTRSQKRPVSKPQTKREAQKR